jgi:hypothetical protein
MEEFLKAWSNFNWASTHACIEYRVYYNSTDGQIIEYSNDIKDLPYLIIDKNIWNQNRFDLKVKEGKLILPKPSVGKLRPDRDGTSCHPDDITLIIAPGPEAKYWKNHTYDNN